jgi:cytochrome c-type biogenesis protein CcmE
MMVVVVVVAAVVMMVVMVVVVVSDGDKVFAVPADIVDAGHGERNVTSMREPRVRLDL